MIDDLATPQVAKPRHRKFFTVLLLGVGFLVTGVCLMGGIVRIVGSAAIDSLIGLVALLLGVATIKATARIPTDIRLTKRQRLALSFPPAIGFIGFAAFVFVGGIVVIDSRRDPLIALALGILAALVPYAAFHYDGGRRKVRQAAVIEFPCGACGDWVTQPETLRGRAGVVCPKCGHRNAFG